MEMQTFITEDIDAAISEVAVLIDEATVAGPHWKRRDESRVWLQLVSCILGSAVRAEHARAATDALANSGVLSQLQQNWRRSLVKDVIAILSDPILDKGTGRTFRYRFPRSRGTSIHASAGLFYSPGRNGISDALARFEDGAAARRWFTGSVPGIGPKQASLFLRGIGYTTDLAVLDVHILKYLRLHGHVTSGPPSSLRAYETLEDHFRQRSSLLGLETGILDYATWIVMRSLDHTVI